LTKGERDGSEHKVMIMRCEDYNPEKICGIIKEGLEELNVRPAGGSFKPNAVIAHQRYFPCFYQKRVP